MTNMSIQPLWLTHFIEIILVLEFKLTKLIAGKFSYKAHFRPQISSNATLAIDESTPADESALADKSAPTDEGRASNHRSDEGCRTGKK